MDCSSCSPSRRQQCLCCQSHQGAPNSRVLDAAEQCRLPASHGVTSNCSTAWNTKHPSQNCLVQLQPLKTPRRHLCTCCTNPTKQKLCFVFLRWAAAGCDRARLSPDNRSRPRPRPAQPVQGDKDGAQGTFQTPQQLWTVLVTFQSSFHALRLTLGQLMS